MDDKIILKNGIPSHRSYEAAIVYPPVSQRLWNKPGRCPMTGH